MGDERWTPEVIVSCLSYRPRLIIEGMITISEPAKRSSIKRQARSSIGFLDRLPPEILHMTLNLLDFKSLSYFSRTSLVGKDLVESLPAYRDLMQYAPRTLRALGKTGLLRVHLAATIYQTMQSEACISCGDYGAFLFLLTCQRCCFRCLRRNPELWVISSTLARQCFNLSSNNLKRVPALRSIPGTYSTSQKSRRRRLRLVDVKTARELESKLRGRTDDLDNPHGNIRPAPLGVRTVLFRWLRSASLQATNQDSSTALREQDRPADDCDGMGSIPFPSLSPTHGIDYGHWCYGCKSMFNRYYLGNPLPSGVLAKIAPAGVDLSRVLYDRQNTARSKSGFLQHVQDCFGAQQMMATRPCVLEKDPDYYATLG